MDDKEKSLGSLMGTKDLLLIGCGAADLYNQAELQHSVLRDRLVDTSVELLDYNSVGVGLHGKDVNRGA